MTWFRAMLIFFVLLLPSLPIEGKDPAFATLLTTHPHIQKEIVRKHNELRRGVNPSASNMLKMEWSLDASGNAQRWANKCILEHSNPDERKTNTRCGENLYMSTDPTAWSTLIQSWYDESADFTYGVGARPNTAVGHYTQLVWYSSHKIGCAVAYCPQQENLKYFYVCQYCPAGNNVLKKANPYEEGTACASCPSKCENGLCMNVQQEILDKRECQSCFTKTSSHQYIEIINGSQLRSSGKTYLNCNGCYYYNTSQMTPNSCDYEDLLSNCESLKSSAGCDHELLKEKCQATCLCEDKIH